MTTEAAEKLMEARKELAALEEDVEYVLESTGLKIADQEGWIEEVLKLVKVRSTRARLLVAEAEKEVA